MRTRQNNFTRSYTLTCSINQNRYRNPKVPPSTSINNLTKYSHHRRGFFQDFFNCFLPIRGRRNQQKGDEYGRDVPCKFKCPSHIAPPNKKTKRNKYIQCKCKSLHALNYMLLFMQGLNMQLRNYHYDKVCT